MKVEKNKKITIEQLAVMVQRGFEGTATKDDLKKFATKDDLQVLADGMDLMRADIRDIKINMGPLMQTSFFQERDIDELKDRVTLLEQKTGIK